MNEFAQYMHLPGLGDYFAEFAAAERPTEPSQTGLTRMSVSTLQVLLNQLGEKVGSDGLFGPTTKGAWARQAQKYGMNAAFDRAAPDAAWVSLSTYNALSKVAYPSTTAAKPTAKPTAKPAAKSTKTAAKPAAAPAAGTVVKTVLELQDLLFGVGWTTKKLTRDGKYGTQTKNAWTISAKSRGLPVLFERVDGKNARVAQSSYDKIKADGITSAAQKKVSPPLTQTPAAKPAAAGTVDRPVLELQDLLFGVGWTSKKLTRDGDFGPQTKRAWGISATTRKLPVLFERVDGKTARVSKATYDKIKADGGGAAAKPTEPVVEKVKPPTGLVDKSVAELQGLLYGVGWTTAKLTGDGKFGSQTKNAWAGSAKLRGLPTTFERVDGRTARVDATTYEALKAKMPATKVDKPVEPTKPGEPTKPTTPKGLVDKSVAELQGLLYGVGWTTAKLTGDGKFGSQTKNAWAGSAKLRGLPQTFERVDGRTARVDATTYEALKAKMPATKVPTSTSTELKSGVVGKYKKGELFRIVLKENSSTGYSWIPVTSDVVELVDSQYVSDPTPGGGFTGGGGVRTLTFRAIKSGAFKIANKPPGRTEPKDFKEYVIDVAGSGAVKTPAGLVDKSVTELQDILYGVGWTSKKLTKDGKYGTQTKNAWAGSAKLRNLPGTFERVDGRTARVAATTYEALKSKMPVAGKDGRPPDGGSDLAQGLITKPVIEVQKLLQAIGYKARVVPTSGKFDNNTHKAWAEAAKKRGQSPTFTKVDARTAKLHVGTFNVISDEVDKKKPDGPKPPPISSLSAETKAMLKAATVGVSAEKLQQAMALWATSLKLEPAQITGTWSQASTDMFFKTFGTDIKQAQGAGLFKIWQEAFPHLVSSDGRTVKLTSAYANLVPALAQKWVETQQNVTPAPLPGPTPTPEPGPMPGPEPMPAPGPGPGGGGGGGGGPAPDPFFDTPSGGEGGGPAPDPEPGPPPPAAEDTAKVWAGAAAALQSLTQKAPVIEKALADARTRGELHPEVKAVVEAWVASANKLMGSVADVISGSPDLRAALDVSGPSVGFAGIRGWGSELAAYFGDLEAVAEKAVELLRTPLPSPGSLQGLGQPIPPAAAPIAARVASAAWLRLMELLRLPVVTAAGAAAMGGKVISDSINGETEAYLSHEAALDQLVAEGKLTVEEYNALKKDIPKQGSIIGPIVLGVVALGGLALYLKNKGSGGSHALARR